MARPPLTNGHDLKVTSSDSEIPDAPPSQTMKVNGHSESLTSTSLQIADGEGSTLLESTQTTRELDSSLPISGGSGESLLPTSSQPVIEPLDDAGMNLDLLPVDATTVVIQQPLSEMRVDAQPTSAERTAEIKEQKQHQDLAQIADSAEDSTASVLQPPEMTTAPEDSIGQVVPALGQHSEPVVAEQSEQGHADPTSNVVESDAVGQQISEGIEGKDPNPPDTPVVQDTGSEAPMDPVQSPHVPTNLPTTTLPISEPTDHDMQDAAPAPTKISREREDDDVTDEPSAKRTKTDEESAQETEFKVPERPTIDTDVGGSESAPSQAASGLMTKPQQKHLLKTVGNVKRIAAAKWFIAPVDWETLKIPTYPTIITNPMDLKTLEDNLRADKYSTVETVIADFNLIPNNARTFNGPEHAVTVQANIMKASFDKAMEKLPGPEITEINTSERKKKAPSPGTVKIPPPRRESRSSLPGSARSPPASAVSPQTFALGPEGVPLIRRDSTMTDRPKREIHKPAPRDLPYANTKPKKKKYQWELKFCEKVLAELSKPKYQGLSYPFMVPVDPVALNIPTYFQVVKKPMDFSKIRENLSQGQYENAKEFEADVRQVFKNCYLFNPPGDIIHQTGRDFEKVFDSEWAQKRQWIENNTPASGPQSLGSSEAEDSDEEDEEEEEEEEEDAEQSNELTKLQQHIAALSKQVEMIQKKKKSPPVANKKTAKASKPTKKEKKAAPTAPSKTDKKATKTKKEKVPYVTYEQKQDISERINMLPDQKMATALGIIRSGMPTLEGVEQDEIELDIDELNNEVLYKLLLFVRKHAPKKDDSPAPPKPKATSSSAAPARKKNKPMSKHEQEARIAQVQSSLSAYQQGSPPSREPNPFYCSWNKLTHL